MCALHKLSKQVLWRLRVRVELHTVHKAVGNIDVKHEVLEPEVLEHFVEVAALVLSLGKLEVAEEPADVRLAVCVEEAWTVRSAPSPRLTPAKSVSVGRM